jgi:squalene-associated FAD-dependent desaturase
VDVGQELSDTGFEKGTDVAIVGGGYAGLAAAVELGAAGIPVTVFESSRTLGGRARRVELNGLPVDNGQHLLVGAYVELLRLMQLIGADASRLFSRRCLELSFADGFNLHAPNLPEPLHMAAALLGATLSLPQRLAALRFMRTLKRSRFQLAEDTTVADLLDRHRQPLAVRSHLWEPLCVAALNTPAASASAQVFASVLQDSLAGPRAASDLLFPAVDLSALFPEPAAAYLRAKGGAVRSECGVKRIALTANGFKVSHDQGMNTFSHVIVAVAPYHLAPLLADLPALAQPLQLTEALRHEPIATAYLAYPDGIRLAKPMLGLTRGHAQWLFDRGALVGQRGLIAAVISASGPWQVLAPEQLLAEIHGEIGTVIENLPAPQWSRLIVEKRATFACTPNVRRPTTVTPLPGLYLAGDYVESAYPATLETAVRSGVAAARSILEPTGGQP